ncbi:calcium-translocating P-type ATPase [Ascoidea rubescens DSM 1968]|uniref:Calcium-transporting ATPase n=1 Tax=Ascoidea rubescens DSM 1968 TaxID=1344418 RepID=A0A1D2VK68_9ASCO|nr:calcium-translocating P-type ATPase [Ascoidea rubescens DSM 1968]ODV61917.1 calcium-translocating P-type ATPase [Ascoidea rubescens DSM 1968]
MSVNYARQAGKILCIGRNYVNQYSELSSLKNVQPFYFLKPSSSILLPNEGPVLIPKGVVVNHEIELVVVMGKTLKNIDPNNFSDQDALDSIKGYALAIDFTAKNVQDEAKKKGLPWSISKGFDTFCPLSSFIPKEKIPDPYKARLHFEINGETKQDDYVELMITRINKIMSEMSSIMTLEKGDLILTGTPKGIGSVAVGDHIENSPSYPDDFLPYSAEHLSSLHDPKSILKFIQLLNGKTIYDFFNNLKTDPKNGLSSEELSSSSLLDQRISRYGQNKIPVTPPKSFFTLCWIALQDKIMIILTIAAVISLSLGLYETFGEDPELDAQGKKIPQVEWVEGVAILVAVAVVVLVSAANDFQKERQFAKLNSKKEDRDIIVNRNGIECYISIHNIVVGDLIKLQTGDVVPADSILVDGKCECDESNITGESQTIKKVSLAPALEKYNKEFSNSTADIGYEKRVLDPFMISGTKLISGLGDAVVTAVGPNSMHGKAMMSLKVEPDPTPMTVRLDHLANGINKFAIIGGCILFLVLILKFCSELPSGGKYHELPGTEKGTKVLDIFITAVALIVVAVPEGLPLAVTLALAFATTRMAKDGNLVRILKACETMGGATAVCSDKTGTLTENRMRVVRGVFGGLEFNNTGTHHVVNDKIIFDDAIEEKHQSNQPVLNTSNDIKQNLSSKLKNYLLSNITLNSSAFRNLEPANLISISPKKSKRFRLFKKKSELVFAENSEKYNGSKTEIALMYLAEDLFDMDDSKSLDFLRKNTTQLNIKRIVQVIPFESFRKWSALVVENDSGNFTFYIKGASEIVLSKCGFYYKNENDALDFFDEESLSLMNKKIEFYADNALRTISLAHKDFESWPPSPNVLNEARTEIDPDLFFESLVVDNNLYDKSPFENVPTIVVAGEDDKFDNKLSSLVFDGLVGIHDPLREGVADAITQCEAAGVTVRMVTGDNIMTARSIALGCGILTPALLRNPNSCMEGPTFRKLPKEEIKRIIPILKVLARSSPEDKRILVENLKEMKEVVAVTGDGTNDAPALRLADVGFSMGISGTEVAREASDIILMTDDFSAIVKAIKWGRCVSVSIKKFLQFQLTVNITAVVLTFVSAVASSDNESVLTPVQLLWVNLIMDTFAALALATDKPDDHILETRPDGRKAPLIAVSTWKMILGQSCTQLIVTFVLHFCGERIFFDGEATGYQKQQLHAMTFNTFVWLQLWKLFVTRKLNEADGIKRVRDRITMRNLNFFQDLFRNYYFLAIAVLIAGIQVLIMFVGGTAFSVTDQTGAMWGTAIICGMLSLPAGVIIRIIPDEWVMKIFPSRLFKWTVYFLSFDFIRKSKKSPRSKNRKNYDDLNNTKDLEASNNNKELGKDETEQERSIFGLKFTRKRKNSALSDNTCICNKDEEKGFFEENGHLGLPSKPGNQSSSSTKNSISPSDISATTAVN